MKNTNNWWRKPFAFRTWKWYNWLVMFAFVTVLGVVMRFATGLLFSHVYSLRELLSYAIVWATIITLGYYVFRNRLSRP